jgi:hypothetical protein
LTHIKQRKTPQNQVQNYGSKLKVQNLLASAVLHRENSQSFQGHVLTLAVPKKLAFESLSGYIPRSLLRSYDGA